MIGTWRTDKICWVYAVYLMYAWEGVCPVLPKYTKQYQQYWRDRVPEGTGEYREGGDEYSRGREETSTVEGGRGPPNEYTQGLWGVPSKRITGQRVSNVRDAPEGRLPSVQRVPIILGVPGIPGIHIGLGPPPQGVASVREGRNCTRWGTPKLSGVPDDRCERCCVHFGKGSEIRS